MQTTQLATWLASRGYKTSLITWNEGGPNPEMLRGVQVIKTCAANAGVPFLRFFYPRWSSLYRALRRANADLYYHNVAEYTTGLVAAWCHRWHRKFVYSVSSDVSCYRRLPELPKRRDRFLYTYGLRHADRLIAQTQRQQKLLKDGFGLSSYVLPMPCICPGLGEPCDSPPPMPQRIAWVARIDRIKRLEWFLGFAERLPHLKFDIVAANFLAAGRDAGLATYARELHSRAHCLANVTWHGALSRRELISVYTGAACLCCTSVNEGFPNTFLEAWSFGRPVVTSFDPDDVVGNLNLGLLAKTPEQFLDALQRITTSPHAWREMSRNAWHYYNAYHRPEVALPRFEAQFLELCGASEGEVGETSAPMRFPLPSGEEAGHVL